jgi:hypothetical protein
MSVKRYEIGEIYLTTCTHPDYTHLKYVGLDTKCDPQYIGSSVVLKWWVKLLGRQYFDKRVLCKVSGSMSEMCAVEQGYILKYDAVRNPNFLNMNGGQQGLSVEDYVVSMDFNIVPTSQVSQGFVNRILRGFTENGVPLSQGKKNVASRVLCVALYGYLKYGQEQFEYSKYSNYCGCDSSVVESVLGLLTENGWIDVAGGFIVIQDRLIEGMPEEVLHTQFKSVIMNYE